MSKRERDLWQGIDLGAQNALSARDYRTASFAQELARRGVEAAELVGADMKQREIKDAWIPGVEIFPRTVYPAASPRILWGIRAARRRRSRPDWTLAEAMVGCADVCAHCEGFPRASTVRSGRQHCGRLVAPLVRR